MSFPGVQTGRDTFLVDEDLDRLRTRVGEYFDAALSHEEIARRYPRVMTDTARFDARGVRDTLLARGGPCETGFVRYAYRPFDNRWLYWEAETKLLREKSPRYPRHVFDEESCGSQKCLASGRDATRTAGRCHIKSGGASL